MLRITIFMLLVLIQSSVSHSFNAATHHQILKSALTFIRTHKSQNATMSEWLALAQRKSGKDNLDPLERLLLRPLVDADYQDDLWFGAWYHPPFAGGKADTLGMLTSLYHFTNVTKAGRYWRYDGYSYENSSKLGNDAMLGISGLKIKLDLSPTLRKYVDEPIQSVADATMPPSYLLAVDAFEDTIYSSLSRESKRTTWSKDLIFATNFIMTDKFKHKFASEEIGGLPSKMQSLGIALHIAQDLAMPHHAQGIAGLCHNVLETYVDSLLCPAGVEVKTDSYDNGTFDETHLQNCQELYDAQEIEALINENPALSASSKMPLEDRLIELAFMSAEYKVAPLNRRKKALKIQRDDRTIFSGSCKEIPKSQAMFRVAKNQYQLATAATVMLIELAARNYMTSKQ